VTGELPRLPLLSEWHRVAEDAGRLIFEFGGEAVCFEGRATRTLLPALLPLLDGTRTVPELVGILGDPARPAVEAALALLADHGLLTEGPPLDAGEPAPFAAAARAGASIGALSPAVARARLREAEVGVIGSGAIAAESARLLRMSGVGHVASRDWEEPVQGVAVVAPGAGETAFLRALNERLLATSTPWLQVLSFDGSFAAVGPLFVPGETCCYECYLRRRAANVDYPDEFWALQRGPISVIEDPATVAAVAGLASAFLLRWLLFADPFVAGVLFALELGHEPRLAPHVVYRVPRCPVCSEATRVAQPLPWAEAS
jgi:bacteriocin biosynthesis cyclodehydratase domain-containing protein